MADEQNSIEVVIQDLVTGQEIDATLPIRTPISELLRSITTQLGAQNAGQHTLRNKTQSFEYVTSDTLASRNTQENDILGLAYNAEFGRE